MKSLLKQFVLILLLFVAFGGRVVAYAIPEKLEVKEVIKKNQTDDCEKSSSEKNQLEEKVKIPDLHLNHLLSLDFTKSKISNKGVGTDRYLLTYCHLQVPEQPPK